MSVITTAAATAGHLVAAVGHTAAGAAAPGHMVYASSVDLQSGWNQLMSLIPGGFKTGLAIFGAALVVYDVIRYLWKRHRGQAGSNVKFPWVGIVVGALCVSPVLVGAVVLPLVDGLASIIMSIVGGLGSRIG